VPSDDAPGVTTNVVQAVIVQQQKRGRIIPEIRSEYLMMCYENISFRNLYYHINQLGIVPKNWKYYENTK